MLVVLFKDAQKQLEKLPKPQQLKIKKRLLALVDNPFSGKKLGGELEDKRSLKVWPYRVIYSINQTEKRVEVFTILHRQGAYK